MSGKKIEVLEYAKKALIDPNGYCDKVKQLKAYKEVCKYLYRLNNHDIKKYKLYGFILNIFGLTRDEFFSNFSRELTGLYNDSKEEKKYLLLLINHINSYLSNENYQHLDTVKSVLMSINLLHYMRNDYYKNIYDIYSNINSGITYIPNRDLSYGDKELKMQITNDFKSLLKHI